MMRCGYDHKKKPQGPLRKRKQDKVVPSSSSSSSSSSDEAAPPSPPSSEDDSGSEKEQKKRVPAAKNLQNTPLFENLVTFSLDQITEAAAYFKKYGFVVITNVMSKARRLNFIKELVKGVLLRQPWSLAAPFRVCDPVTGEELDIDRDTERFVEAFTRFHLDKKTLEMLYESAPFHAGFGAPCDGKGFHLPEMWNTRQDPLLYKLFCKLMGGRKKLFVDINRPIVKYPGKGDHEFLHWDMNPLAWIDDEDSGADPDENEEGIAGKVAVTKGAVLIAVPGSHTAVAHAHIAKHYRPLYPNVRPNSPKFGLDPKKEDPLDLFERARVIQVPEGGAVFWSTKLLHGVRKLSVEAGVQLGFYLGAMPAEDRPEYKKKAGISEVEDRVRSWRECAAPRLFPSLDTIHYYPNNYTRFPLKYLWKFVDKTNPGWPGLVKKRIASGKTEGTEYMAFVPVPDPNPVPPPLTELGQKLLGLVPW